MSQIKTVFQVKIFPQRRSKGKVTSETIAVNAIGQESANEVDKHYQGYNTSKVLKGFMIDEKFVPVELQSPWDNQKPINQPKPII